MNKIFLIFIICISILFAFIISFLIVENKNTNDKLNKVMTTNDSLRKFIGRVYQDPQLICDSVLNRDNLYNYIKLKGILWPNVVWAQSMVETGYLSCKKCCLQYNNLFGFLIGRRCIKFDTWQECVDYYGRWQTKYMRNREDYMSFLKRIGYATFNGYETHVAQVLLDNKLKYKYN